MELRRLLLSLGLVFLLCGCRSIRINTGPPTDEEATAQAANRGSQFRSEWTDRLRQATVPEQARLLKSFIDSTSARYLRYGYQIADQWQEEGDRRGVEVPVDDIRQMVDASTRTEQPLFEAYEDVLEYGIEGIQQARYFDRATEELLIRYRDHYLEVYSAVFYPNGSWEDFLQQLQVLQTRSEDLSLRLGEELRKYH